MCMHVYAYMGVHMYLYGSKYVCINTNGGTEDDVKARTQKARVGFIRLKTVWRAKQIEIRTT